MSTWAAFAAAAPELADAGFRLFVALEKRGFPPDEWFGIGFLATVRPDGGPALAPVCPICVDGRLFLAAVGPKVRDLDRDPRYVLHAFLGESDAEFAIRGRAHRVHDGAVSDAVKRVVAGTGMLADPEAGEVLIELDIEQVDAAVWENVGQPGTRPIKTRWRRPS